MRKLTSFTLLCLFTVLLFSCNNKKEEQQRQQARQDSIALARQQQRQVEQQRMDSLAAVRADSIAAANKEPVFNPDEAGMSAEGHYAVQVGAWRSKTKAQELAEAWAPKGFENAFVVQYGNEETGNVWFRVRLGRFTNKEQAQLLQSWLTENFQTKSWISYVE